MKQKISVSVSNFLFAYAMFIKAIFTSAFLGLCMRMSLMHQLLLSIFSSELDLSISDCISQCYDGASVMSGCCSGVSARILEMNPKAVYIHVHCCAHRLNLVLVDSCKSVAAASDFFSLLEALYVFISSSIPHSLFVQSKLSRDK